MLVDGSNKQTPELFRFPVTAAVCMLIAQSEAVVPIAILPVFRILILSVFPSSGSFDSGNVYVGIKT